MKGLSKILKKLGKVIVVFILLIIGGVLLINVLMLIQGDIYINDLDEYKESGSNADSSMSITSFQYFLPSSTFLDDFSYIDGMYHYYEHTNMWGRGYEISLIRLLYEESTYNEAKIYALGSMDLSNDNTYLYNGYEFIENLALPKEYKKFENGKNINFPYHFIMFCFNDLTNEIIFLGFWCDFKVESKADIALTEWKIFLRNYYSKYYDFDN